LRCCMTERVSTVRKEGSRRSTYAVRQARKNEIVGIVSQLFVVLVRSYRFVHIVERCFGDLEGARKGRVVGVVGLGVSEDLQVRRVSKVGTREEGQANLVDE
jgi:hypothetical protein